MSQVLAPVAQMVREYGMNRKVGGSSPSWIETFSVSITSTLSKKTSVRESKMNAVIHAQLTLQMLDLHRKYQYMKFGDLDGSTQDCDNSI